MSDRVTENMREVIVVTAASEDINGYLWKEMLE